jgi:large subunit ribosomal protein L4
MRRLALKMALSEKVRNGELMVLEDLKLPAPKTKEMVKVLTNLGAPKKAFIVTPERDEVVYRSSRNLPGVLAGGVHSLNVYDVLKHDRLILTKEAVAKVEEVLG